MINVCVWPNCAENNNFKVDQTFLITATVEISTMSTGVRECFYTGGREAGGDSLVHHLTALRASKIFTDSSNIPESDHNGI
jgi:hypothetical protein